MGKAHYDPNGASLSTHRHPSEAQQGKPERNITMTLECNNMVTDGITSVEGFGWVRTERMVARNEPSGYVEMWIWTFMPDS